MVSQLYTTKDASALTGASRQIIRAYTDRYKEHFCSEVQAQPGQPRRFTDQDLKLIAYIYQQTGQASQKHDQVLASLAAGALDAFDWQVPEVSESKDPGEPSPGTALVPVERLQAAQALMLDAQRREQEAITRAEEQARQLSEQAIQRERQLQDQINQLLRELGHKEGELEALRVSKPKSFWARLLGRD